MPETACSQATSFGFQLENQSFTKKAGGFAYSPAHLAAYLSQFVFCWEGKKCIFHIPTAAALPMLHFCVKRWRYCHGKGAAEPERQIVWKSFRGSCLQLNYGKQEIALYSVYAFSISPANTSRLLWPISAPFSIKSFCNVRIST